MPRPLTAARFHHRVERSDGAVEEVPGGVLDAVHLDTLDHRATLTLAIAQPSGLAWDQGALLVVGDERRAVYWVDPETGAILRRMPTPEGDLEAVAVDPVRDTLLVVPERSGEVLRMSRDGDVLDRVRVPGAADGNAGLEGLAVRDDGTWVLAKEKHPARLIVLSPHGELLATHPVDYLADVSELAWSSEGWLYALSHEDRALIRLKPDLSGPSARWGLPLEQAEGLVVHGDRVFIACDASAELMIMDLNRGVR